MISAEETLTWQLQTADPSKMTDTLINLSKKVYLVKLLSTLYSKQHCAPS